MRQERIDGPGWRFSERQQFQRIKNEGKKSGNVRQKFERKREGAKEKKNERR